MVYISLLQHSDTGVKAKEYYMMPLWALFSHCPPEGGGLGFITTLTMQGGLSINAQTIQLECHRQVAKSLDRGGYSYKQSTFHPLFL